MDELEPHHCPSAPPLTLKPVRAGNKNLIQELIDIDRIDELINLRGLRASSADDDEDNNSTGNGGASPPSQRLSRIGDEIVEKLVDWTKLLPFYAELPVEVHTHLLTKRWAELVLLSACFYASITTSQQHCATIITVVATTSNGALPTDGPVSSTTIDVDTATSHQQQLRVSFTDATINLHLLQKRLSSVMGKPIPIEHVAREAGALVDKFTQLLTSFAKLRLTIESYVCLKAITLLHAGQLVSLLFFVSERDPPTDNSCSCAIEMVHQ
jgi:nuclear receptor subfamily 6 group A